MQHVLLVIIPVAMAMFGFWVFRQWVLSKTSVWLSKNKVSGARGGSARLIADWPEFEGHVLTVESVEQWLELTRRVAQRSGPRLLIVDLYTRRCSVCKHAALKIARMSLELDAIFAKVDVDAAPHLAHTLGADRLPAFKLFGVPMNPPKQQQQKGYDQQQLVQQDAVVGWDEDRIRWMLEVHGVNRSPR